VDELEKCQDAEAASLVRLSELVDSRCVTPTDCAVLGFRVDTKRCSGGGHSGFRIRVNLSVFAISATDAQAPRLESGTGG
jgi:hypothetical protein